MKMMYPAQIDQQQLQPDALELLRMLEAAGCSAWLVGGCVRDLLRGETPHDWDIATSAEPERVKRIFSGYRLLDYGMQHGTVAVCAGKSCYEITTYRTEEGYSDHRRPDHVTFVDDIESDLQRRDFTVNAMAYHPDRGLLDPYGGLQDLENRRLRCVGEPQMRFREDALRIVRAMRFSAQLGLTIEAQTLQAMHTLAPALHSIAAERIGAECTKLLCADAQQAAQTLRTCREIWFVLFPELRPMYGCAQHHVRHQYDVWEHTLHALAAMRLDTPALRWAALLHDSGKPACKTTDEQGVDHFRGHPAVSVQIASDLMQALHLDKHLIERTAAVIRIHDHRVPQSQRSMRRLLFKNGEQTVRDYLHMRHADSSGQADFAIIADQPLINAAWVFLHEILDQQQCFTLRQLAVDGRDMLAIGCPRGKEIGQVLDHLLQCVIDGELPNERQTLLRTAQGFLQKIDQKSILE